MQTDNNTKKEVHFCYDSIMSFKEIGDEVIVGGYIATTHFDGQDKITKEALDMWAKEINDGNPRANKVSVNHNRIPHVAGVGLKGSAKVTMLPDGEFGLYAETKIDKTRDDFEDIKYRIDNKFLDSFSIEYVASENSQYSDGVRILDQDTTLFGWTLASQPMNEHAVMIKEMFKSSKEEIKMEENISKVEPKEETKVEEPVVESKEDIKVEPAEEPKEEPKVEEPKKEPVEESKEISDLKKEVMELKTMIETKEKDVLAAKEEVKKEINNIDVKEEVKINKDVKMETKEIKQYKEIFSSKVSGIESFKRAAALVGKEMLFKPSAPSEFKTFDNFGTNGSNIEFKGLGITSNQNTDTDYLLSSAELSDIFDPVIYNYLNQKTSTWNILEKDNFSNKGNNQVQFTIKTVKNTSASAYTGDSVSSGNIGRLKLMTKFKKYQVGVAVSGDMIAAARGGAINDVFGQEVKDSTDDLLEVQNAALYAEVGAESAAGVIGFEYITDSAGNTTLYNLTRSAANQLAPDSAANTYINGSSADVSVANLRAAIRNAIEEGADLMDLAFFCSPIQYDKIKSIYDGSQRLIPVSSRFGFEGRMSFDEVPIFYDKDCNDDDIFLVDLATHRIAIWVPPTLEMLGKDSDSVKGFIKSYWCTYNRAPRRMVQIYGNATA